MNLWNVAYMDDQAAPAHWRLRVRARRLSRQREGRLRTALLHRLTRVGRLRKPGQDKSFLFSCCFARVRGPLRKSPHSRSSTVGWSLAFRSGLGLILTLLLIPPVLARINAEEKLLHAQFGDKYNAYCSHTWRLIPGL